MADGEANNPEGAGLPRETAAPVNVKVEAAAVSIKLPPFWAADSELWVSQVEAQFAIRNITSQNTKFYHVVGSLTPEVATEVRDVILNPDNERPYDVLKEALLQRTAISEQKRLQELLSQEEIGDRKPSQVLRRMQQLAGGQAVDPKLMRSLFINKLPKSVQQILASVGDKVELSELANMADAVIDVTAGSTQVSEIKQNPAQTSEINQLKADVAELKNMMSDMMKTRPRSASRGRSPYRKQRDVSRFPLCWYHFKFRENANRCEQPCSWQSGNEAAGRK